MSEKTVSKSIEEYLETLYTLTRGGKTANVKEISERLGVAPPSVTEMLKKLADKGYVRYSPYHGATLTEDGLRIGTRVSRKHRLLERFLHDILKIGRDTVHKQTCEMEHSLSDEAETALCQFLGHPNECPDDGKPIQPCDLPFTNCEECRARQGEGWTQVGRRRGNLVSLTELREQDRGKGVFIRGEHKELRRLLDMGLTPNTLIRVVRAAPFAGPVEIAVRGSKLALGHRIASAVFVEVVKECGGKWEG